MVRGEIWWASLPVPVGSQPGFRRPVLIIQSNEFNQSRIQTLLVLAITSNTKLAQATGNVLLPRKESGLAKESVANVSQVLTVDKSFLSERVGHLSAPFMQRVDAGLRIVLAL
jgi:mRNA interferase MazF